MARAPRLGLLAVVLALQIMTIGVAYVMTYSFTASRDEYYRTLHFADLTVGFVPAADTEIVAQCYPIETVTKFELKATEVEGWIEQTGIDSLVRRGRVISLSVPLSFVPEVSSIGTQIARVTYTGGYVLPGTTPPPGQTALPADLESAAVEQVAVWHQQKDKLGLFRHCPSSGTYLVLSQLQPLPQVDYGRRCRGTVGTAAEGAAAQ